MGREEVERMKERNEEGKEFYQEWKRGNEMSLTKRERKGKKRQVEWDRDGEGNRVGGRKTEGEIIRMD